MEKIKKNVILLLIIGFLILALVLKDDFYGIIDVLLNANKGYIVIGIMIFIIGDLFKSISITNIIKEQKKEYKYKNGFLLVLETNFFNGITPFSLGGQPFQLYTLKKKNKIDYVTGANVLFKDFYTYQMALVILSTICLCLGYRYSVLIFSNGMKQLILIGFAVNFIISLFLIYLPYSKKNGKVIVTGFITFLTKLKLVKNKDEKISEINDYISNFKTQINKIIVNPKLIFSSILLNIIKLISLGVVTYFCFRSVDSNVPLLSSLVISILIITMASFVPIPGASGGMEFGFITLFSYYVIDAKLSATMLIWRFLTYYLPIIYGAIITVIEGRK